MRCAVRAFRTGSRSRAGRQGLFTLALAIFAWLAVAAGAAASEAAVVVRHGDGSITYAIVVFPEEQISSFELLDRSTISLTTVQFGGLGEAVCTLDGEGCGLSDCRVRLCQTGDPESPFWQFFRQDASNSWISQPLGASASKVRNGDVDGWSWTGRDAGLGPLTVGGIVELIDADVAAVPDGSTQAFVATFDASGKRIERENDSGVGRAATIAGVGALLALAAIGIVVKRRSISRAASL